MMRDYIYHKNEWYWGTTTKIISDDGCSIVELQFDNKYPSIAFVNGVSVVEHQRRKGRANELLYLCEKTAKEKGYEFLQLSANKNNEWLIRWYKSLGFKIIMEDEHEYTMLKMLIH